MLRLRTTNQAPLGMEPKTSQLNYALLVNGSMKDDESNIRPNGKRNRTDCDNERLE